ncbi:hypothetical protein NDU88_004350 [Pleurodeles waltl]|uniref:Uncharacterized protein n=1 Tax=Pleurodeles waltl TaxID=8319 RepID=A0AAV7LJJ5_PLEWA|nr:hypothetical protein NDU88_004350 [Pleurodeles waltl]
MAERSSGSGAASMAKCHTEEHSAQQRACDGPEAVRLTGAVQRAPEAPQSFGDWTARDEWSILCMAPPQEAWYWIESSDGGAESSLRTELPRDGAARRRRRGQRRMRVREQENLPAVPDLEQRIQERHSALQQVAALLNAEGCTSLEAQGSHSSVGKILLLRGPRCRARIIHQMSPAETSDILL